MTQLATQQPVPPTHQRPGGVTLNIHEAIRGSKLGRARKDAQVDMCSVFAAALYDVLDAQGVPCRMVTAKPDDTFNAWAHSVVEVDGRYYDSMGEFSTDIYRVRARIHPKVTLGITFTPDERSECFETDLEDLHVFYVKALRKTLSSLGVK